MFGSDPYARALPSYSGSNGRLSSYSSPYSSYGGAKPKRGASGAGAAVVKGFGLVLLIASGALFYGVKTTRAELAALQLHAQNLEHELTHERVRLRTRARACVCAGSARGEGSSLEGWARAIGAQALPPPLPARLLPQYAPAARTRPCRARALARLHANRPATHRPHRAPKTPAAPQNTRQHVEATLDSERRQGPHAADNWQLQQDIRAQEQQVCLVVWGSARRGAAPSRVQERGAPPRRDAGRAPSPRRPTAGLPHAPPQTNKLAVRTTMYTRRRRTCGSSWRRCALRSPMRCTATT